MRPTRVVTFIVLFLWGVLVPAQSGAVSQLTFGPSADVYVSKSKPTTNFGATTTVEVDNSPIENVLLRFVVAGIGTNQVTSAKLRLYDTNSSKKGGDFYRLAPTNPPWSETAVNFGTAPRVVGTAVASLGSVSTKKWYEVELASIITGDGTFEVGMTSTNSDGAGYASKEASTVANRPQLVVTYDTPPDGVAPSVSITSPGNGDTVAGTVPVAASASDNVAVTKVEFFVDASLAATDASSPFGFDWNTTGSSNAAHNLTAKAFDAAGNAATSAPIGVTVANPVDTEPPTAPSNLTASASAPNRVNLTWTASTDNVGVAGYAISRGGATLAQTANTSYTDTSVSPATAYEYVVMASDGAGNHSADSNTASVTTPATVPSISFAAAGDHGSSESGAGISLNALNGSGVNFYVALGDFAYTTAPESAWCDFVTSHLSALGPEFPFQLISGNHEAGGGDGNVLNFAACLPDRMNSTMGPNNQYAAEYYFDYPAVAPLVRMVLIAPALTINAEAYSYKVGTAHYAWLGGVIDNARASGIPWVVVGMHEVCITTGSKSCSISADLMNLLVSKKVDLVLQGHDHNYQRGKQLALNASTCPAVPAGSFDGDCVADDGADGAYTRGGGTIFLISGTFGKGLYSVSSSDSEAGYFAKIDSSTNGFVKYTLSATRLDAQFVNTIGSFTDSFSIVP